MQAQVLEQAWEQVCASDLRGDFVVARVVDAAVPTVSWLLCGKASSVHLSCNPIVLEERASGVDHLVAFARRSAMPCVVAQLALLLLV